MPIASLDLNNPKLNQSLRLRDGRRLGFAEFGEPGGRPFLYCHGWPSSRFEPQTVAPVINTLGLRVIAADRPGYGLSDAQPGRQLVDWPEILCQLADHLHLERFGMIGVSGGGPYAAVCAAEIPERLTVVVLICALGPVDNPQTIQGMVALNRWLLSLARNAPWVAEKLATTCLRLFWGKGEQIIPDQIASRLPEADRRLFKDPRLREPLIASAREALRGGPHGAASDGLLYARPWGFRLEDIRAPVHLWHGEKDIIVPPAMGHYLATHIPNCHATFCPEDGHFSLPYGRLEEVLRAV